MPEPAHEPYVEPGREPYFDPGRSMPDEDFWREDPPENDGLLGAAAQMLLEDGHQKAAALLLDVKELTFDDSDGWMDNSLRSATADLSVDPWVMRRFDDETKEQIRDTLDKVALSRGLYVFGVCVIPAPAPPGWRDQLQKVLASPTARNQVTLAPLPPAHPHEDGLAFRDAAELQVYKALKARQDQMPKADTFTIVPNCGARVQHRTIEPDFLVIYRGRCAGIEVDGASHSRKWASDRSREYSLEDSGLAFVRRIDAADTSKPQELQAFIDSVLRKLGSS
jgi:hypothetical protein